MHPIDTVSILAHEKLAYTQKGMEAVLANSDGVDIILTDNGCTDGTAAELTGQDWVKMTPFPSNRPLIPCTQKFEPYVNAWLQERGFSP